MNHFLQDARYGIRMLRRSPWFTLIAVLSLALGIGANTAIFSLVNAVMLRALPVRQPNRLVLFGAGHWGGTTDDFPDTSWQLFSYPFYREVQQKNHVFSGVTAIQSLDNPLHGTVQGSASAEKIKAQLVSGTYFSVLGVNPAVGQAFTPDMDQTPGGHPVAVASYDWWTRRFARDPSIVGKTVTIQSTVYTIIGVAPPEFFGTSVGSSPDLWIPLSMEEVVPPGWKGLNDNLFQSLYLIARLKPGTTTAQAQAEVNLLFIQALHAYAGPQPSVKQTEAMKHAKIELTSAAEGLSQLRLQFSKPLTILMGVVGLVLLIACANIANLLLARATARQKEIALRMAIGAGRGRLVRQLLTESVLLALAGGFLGVLFAWWSTRLLLALVSPGAAAPALNVSPDASVLIFTLILSLATALLFGAAPALRTTRLELNSSLKEGRVTGHGQSRSFFAKGLIVGQVALSVVLLIGSGLFLRSLLNLNTVDTGFNKDNVLLLHIDTASAGYKEDGRLVNLHEEIESRVGSLPGVQAASFSMFTFDEGEWTNTAVVPGNTSLSDKDREIMGDRVGSGYFKTMGIQLLLGRTFGSQDTAGSSKVAVINETMAQRFFPGGSPLGRRFILQDWNQSSREYDVEVIGVVKDAKSLSVQQRPYPMAYYPYVQHPALLGDFELRTSASPATMIPEVRKAIAQVDRSLAVSDATTLAEQVDDSLAGQKMMADLTSSFGLLAVFLACIGIYGLMTHMVARRTNEIGIRMALGAGRGRVLWMVMRETVVLAAIGFIVGIPAALAAMRLASSLLFGLSPTDPSTISLAVLSLAAVAALAGYLPARRASLVDPMEALRYE